MALLRLILRREEEYGKSVLRDVLALGSCLSLGCEEEEYWRIDRTYLETLFLFRCRRVSSGRMDSLV